jgi:cobalt/nickel transport system permease protein
MHIPDGMLSAPVWIACGGVGAAAAGISAWRANRKMDERHVPLLGVSGAFVFAAQMLNFPIPGGTSGHFVGGALVGVLLGPSAAVVVLAAVLLIQCFVFRDGGITALGANLVNMGLLGGVLGGLMRSWLGVVSKENQKKLLPVVAFAAGWTACVLGALGCATEIVLSYQPNAKPASLILGTMGTIHAAIGLGEGAITASAVALLQRVRPDLLELERF